MRYAEAKAAHDARKAQQDAFFEEYRARPDRKYPVPSGMSPNTLLPHREGWIKDGIGKYAASRGGVVRVWNMGMWIAAPDYEAPLATQEDLDADDWLLYEQTDADF